MKIVISESQFDKLMKKVSDGENHKTCKSCGKHSIKTSQGDDDQEVDERSRSFAFTRKKRLFSKAEKMANPLRYREADREIAEIGTYKFSDHAKSKKSAHQNAEEYKDVKNVATTVGVVGKFEYLYQVNDNEGTPSVVVYVLDIENKAKAAVAEFELRSGDDFFVTLPYVQKEYRNQGIAMQIYKMILSFGNLISGKAQSHEAAALWKKMFKVLPNKMTFVDDDGKEHEIKDAENKLVIADTGEDVHAEKGGYLKLYKS